MPRTCIRLLAFGSLGLLLSAGSLVAQIPIFSPSTTETKADATPPFSVRAEIIPGKAEGTATLAITGELKKGWHTYSITQKSPGGPTPTKIKLTPNGDFKLAASFTTQPAPEKHTYDFWPDLDVEEHQGRVTWTAPIELAKGVDAGKLTIGGAIRVQVCATECLPPTDYPFKAVARRMTMGIFKGNDSHVAIHGQIEPAAATPGSIAKLTITAVPDAGYHVYALAEADPNTIGAGKPALLMMTSTSNWRTKQPQASAKPVEEQSSIPGIGTQRFHTEQVSWTIEIEVPKDASPGQYPLTGLIGYQACSNNSCDQPLAARFDALLPVGPMAASGALPLMFSEAGYAEVAKLAATRVSPSNGSDGKGFDENLLRASARQDRSILTVFFWAFLGGVALNLMPCVLPVIGLKILSFVEQSHHDRRRTFMLNLWYVLGALSVFMVLAIVAVSLRAAQGFILGEQFGDARFNIAMSVIVFVMALSFMGVWEIPVPGFLGTGKANDLQATEGAPGAFAKGIITTLLATPCAGPGLAIALSYAADPLTPIAGAVAVFLAIGLGMTCPYLIIGLNPRLVRFLPKPGAWMETFKQAMGFLLLATVVYLFTVIDPSYVVPLFALLMALWAACWAVGRLSILATPLRRKTTWAGAVAFSLLVGWFSFGWLEPLMAERNAGRYPGLPTEFADADRKGAVDHDAHLERGEGTEGSSKPGGSWYGSASPGPVSAKSTEPPHQGVESTTHPVSAKVSDAHTLPWQPFSKQALRENTAAGRTVLVDFTAVWCPNCKTLERFVLNTGEIKQFVEQNGVVPLVADLDVSDENRQMLKLLDSTAIPVLAIFPADHPNQPIILRNGYTIKSLLGALQQATPSKVGLSSTADPLR